MGLLEARLGKQPPVEEVENKIREIVKRILGVSSPSQIYLFGSALTSEFTYASDLDFAIIFFSEEEKRVARKNIYGKNLSEGIPADYLCFSQAEFEKRASQGGVCQVIRETGRLLYDKRTKV